MELKYDILYDKIMGCWNGKNIGGMLGAPFEGKRQINDVNFYTQDLSKELPGNDDLDLQLVWLNAIEKYGRRINASLLGEYWLSFITPNWAEYGMAKSNMSGGIKPPLSGYVNNHYKDSCGCFIRSEIWACIMPGHPERAVRYAFEDAIVDHAHEGMYAEIFCTALESAAFVENDISKLLKIACSYIPEGCGIEKAAKLVEKCYNEGRSWQEARTVILTELPGSFGINEKKPSEVDDGLPLGRSGYDAPSNIGIMLIGLFYGEGDFEKSICIAVNCGEDTDCTGATLGALWGILHGAAKMPKKWVKPLSGKINTLCINKCCYLDIPDSVEKLTERAFRMIPVFLDRNDCQFVGIDGLVVYTPEKLMCEDEDLYIKGCFVSQPESIKELLGTSPFMVRHECDTLNVIVDYMGEPFIRAGENKRVRMIITRNDIIDHQQFLNVRFYVSSGIEIKQGNYLTSALNNGYKINSEFLLDIVAETIKESRIDIIADISVAGRHGNNIVKITLFPSA